MAAPVAGPAGLGGGGIQLVLRPPVEFIQRQAHAFQRRLLNLEPLWDRFKPVMQNVEEELFDTAGHGGWPPLAESTLRQKQGAEILVETGVLRDSLVDPNRAAETGPMHMVWGSDVFYAGFHQEGTERMPARPPLQVDVAARRQLEKEMVSWVNSVAADTWGAI